MPDPENRQDRSVNARLRRMRRRVQLWSGRRLPPGLRLIVGILLIGGGVLGFLPLLGFWMIPLGIAVAALDVLPVLRWLRERHR